MISELMMMAIGSKSHRDQQSDGKVVIVLH